MNPQRINVWEFKPWWCQPWSILMTGILVISGSWGLTKTIWVTLLVSLPIVAWWIYFLLIWPKLFTKYYFVSKQAQIEEK